jgi:hypothetical protein
MNYRWSEDRPDIAGEKFKTAPGWSENVRRCALESSS